MNTELMLSLIIASSLGALIGLERQWEEQHEGDQNQSVAGLRTFTFWSMYGFISAYISEHHASHFYLIGFGSFALYLSVVQFLINKEGNRFGLTSFSVAVITFMIGSLVCWGHRQVAVGVSILVILILASKSKVHDWSRRLTPQDIRSTLQFAAITGVVLPFVPDQNYGPFDSFNPFSIWLMVVLVAGIGFAGYITIRIVGSEAGIALTGLIGGLASSTATTIAFSRKSKESPELSSHCAMGIVIACTVMLFRIGLLILLLNHDLFLKLWGMMLVMSVPGVIYSLWSLFRRTNGQHGVGTPALHNPLSLGMALKFALLYAVIVFMARATTHYYGGAGVYPLSILSGLTDMDAIALTLHQMTGGNLITMNQAAIGIILAALSNTALKLGFALVAGSTTMRAELVRVMGGTFIAGIVGLYIFA